MTIFDDFFHFLTLYDDFENFKNSKKNYDDI